jgi:cytochrome c oxidase subunit II
MLDFLYQNGWGAFTMMLLFQIPFLIVFLYVIYRKAYVDPGPTDTDKGTLPRVEGTWLTVVVVLFFAVNIFSIKYMPTFSTVRAAAVGQNIQDVDVTARSWSYEISDREFEVGRPVRFSIKSADTMHGFAVYHPNGKILFTTMLMPGMEQSTTIIHTFDEPGKYKVRCLEYCGIAHHLMQDELIVTQSND